MKTFSISENTGLGTNFPDLKKTNLVHEVVSLGTWTASIFKTDRDGCTRLDAKKTDCKSYQAADSWIQKELKD